MYLLTSCVGFRFRLLATVFVLLASPLLLNNLALYGSDALELDDDAQRSVVGRLCQPNIQWSAVTVLTGKSKTDMVGRILFAVAELAGGLALVGQSHPLSAYA